MSYNKKVLSEIDRELKDRYRSKRYSKSLSATNSLFTVNDLFAKPSRGRVYNPNAQYFQGGGPINTSGPRAEETSVDEDAMNAMMKARLAYEEMHGNPAAKRMVAPVDNPYDFGDGRTGTHYMSSYDNYAIPEIQDVDGTLEMTGPRDNEAIRFDREEDARYFANENYKSISPMFINAELDDEEIQKYVDGGYVVEEMDEGGGVEVESCPTGQAWNGKYCVKIKNIVSGGKKVRVVPTPYEVENPSDDPLTQKFQSVDDIDSTIKRGKKQGYSDNMVDKMICQKGNCHVLTIDDDTEIENIEPVKKRKPIKKNIIDTKQEVIEPEEDRQPEIEIDRLPVILPELITTDTSLPEELEEGEEVGYERKFGAWLQDKATKEAKLKKFLKYSVPEFFNPKKSRNSGYYKTPKKIKAGFYNEPIEQEQLYPEGFAPRFQKGGALELGDQVTEDMVEELRRQGYTIEEI